jgi:hypothetical protein
MGARGFREGCLDERSRDERQFGGSADSGGRTGQTRHGLCQQDGRGLAAFALVGSGSRAGWKVVRFADKAMSSAHDEMQPCQGGGGHLTSQSPSGMQTGVNGGTEWRFSTRSPGAA